MISTTISPHTFISIQHTDTTVISLHLVHFALSLAGTICYNAPALRGVSSAMLLHRIVKRIAHKNVFIS
jgi:hypothetical protein